MRKIADTHPLNIAEQASYLGLCLCFIVFWAMSEAVLAGEEPSVRQAKGQLQFYARDMSAALVAPLALETDIVGTVNGPVFRASVSQRFHNPSDQWLEGVYTFPLPTDATVDRLKMHIGDRVIEGQIKEKSQAKKTYDKAKKEGKRTALLSAPKGNFFTTRVANIAPRSEIVIEFSFQQMLTFKDHGYALRLPIVATPQFDNSVSLPTPVAMSDHRRAYRTDHSSEHSSDHSSEHSSEHGAGHQAGKNTEAQRGSTFEKIVYRSPGEPNANPIRIKIDVDTGMPIKRAWSDSHVVDISQARQGLFSVLMDSTTEHANRDFELNWLYEENAHAQASVFSEKKDGEYFHMLTLLPPAPDTQLAPESRELIFVLDVSGSMSGESIRQAKAALNLAMNTLKPTDLFNLIFFNNDARAVFDTAIPANKGNLNFARRALSQQAAGQGTNIRRALIRALNKRYTDRLRQVVFMTDGAIQDEDSLLEYIQRNLGETRLFTVGIGSAPNGYFMRRASEVGRGTFTFISSTSQVQEKMARLFEKLNRPALTDLQLSFNTPYKDLLPNPLPDLYLNEVKHVLFKTDQAINEMTINANRGDNPVFLQQAVAPDQQRKGVAIEWARRKIQHYTDKANRTTDEVSARYKQSATDLALQHHQVSRYTSLVAVDVTPVRTNEALMRQKLKSNLPKGWQSKKVSGQPLYLAQTANGSVWLLGLGSAILVLSSGLMLCILLRRRIACRVQARRTVANRNRLKRQIIRAKIARGQHEIF